ncbi:cell surface protein, partial [Rhodococcus sp. NPDC057014]
MVSARRVLRRLTVVGLAVAFLSGLAWITVSAFPSDAVAGPQYHECDGGRCEGGSTGSPGGGKPQHPHPPCESRRGCGGGEPSETQEPSETVQPTKPSEPSGTTEPSETGEPSGT